MLRKWIHGRVLCLSILIVASVLVIGCSIKWPSFKTQEAVEYFVIDYPPPPPVVSEPVGGILMVRRFQTSALYGTDRLVAQESIFATDFFYYKRWAMNPGSMVTDLIFRDLTASGLFKAVVAGPGYLTQDCEMVATLESFRAIKMVAGWKTEIVLSVLLYPYSPDSHRPAIEKILQKRYIITSPCPDRTGEAIVASLSHGMQQLSMALMKDMKAYLVSEAVPSSSPRQESGGTASSVLHP